MLNSPTNKGEIKEKLKSAFVITSSGTSPGIFTGKGDVPDDDMKTKAP